MAQARVVSMGVSQCRESTLVDWSAAMGGEDGGTDLEHIMLGPEAPLSEAAAVLRLDPLIALVVDAERRLLGVLTDGDLRRALLRGVDMCDPIRLAMNAAPLTGSVGLPRDRYFERMRSAAVFQLPIVDAAGRVVELAQLKETSQHTDNPTRVVLMAGGLGTRLRPLTDHTPKPMLPVAGRPLLQIIVERFIAAGFGKFTISVNHLAEIIERHFRDGGPLGVEIAYLRETRRLGTAGALSLMDDPIDGPIFVMNGDILTDVDFGAMLRFHNDSGAAATMALNVYRSKVPYGVVEVDGSRITGIEEKPDLKFFVNAGIYVLSPAAVAEIPRDAFFDMPTLFEKLRAQGKMIAGFPIHEHWLDIGRPNDLERAAEVYSETVK